MHRRPGTMESVDADETKLYEVSKHNFGIIKVYLQTALGMILAIFLTYLLLPTVIDDSDQAFYYASLFAGVSVMLSFLVILVSTVVYRQNRLIVTDRNITQVLQYGLFNRKVSQLNIVNVEDVTSVQTGIVPTILNYGTLNIETAGEQSNFHFTYCPNSNYCAKVILDAREKMLGQMKEGDEESDRESNAKLRNARRRRTPHSPKTTPVKRKRRVINKSRTKAEVRNIGAEVLDRSYKKKKK